MDTMQKNSALSALQAEFCIFNLGMPRISYGVIDEVNEVLKGGKHVGLKFYNKADAILLMTRFLENKSIASNPKKDIEDFFKNGNTHIYKAIVFSPLVKSADVLNLWIGPVIKPAIGSCQIIHDFIFENICNSQKNVYEYIVNYLAHMVQKPEEKPGIMIVLLGGQGVGKGTFFSLLQTIWNKTSVLVSCIDQVLGRFNGILERNYIVMLDEALFSGDKKAAEKLKSLITEEYMVIENKYEHQKSITSYHRFFGASNKSHFVNVDADDRRFLFLRVSELKAQNDEYYKSIRDAFKNEETIGAFLHFLQKRDISTFKYRQRPKTSEHTSQKIQSLNGFERWWYEELTNPINISAWVDDAKTNLNSSQSFISSQSLVESYKASDRNSDRYSTIQLNQISMILKKLCPSMRSIRVSTNNKPTRGYNVPKLDLARREFEQYIGSEIDWYVPLMSDTYNLELNYQLDEEDRNSPF
jgi:hypothetical protein